jgi:hypothetical protein
MILLLAVPLLGLARLMPETGVGLWLRLAAATLVLLRPGRFVARALGQRSAAAALTWSCGLTAAGLAVTFALHRSLDLALALVLLAGLVAVPFTLRRHEPVPRGRLAAGLAGLALGAALWSVEGFVHGDALFHLGRVRKLVDFGSLSLRSVDEFADGGLHPGYAFPLWHGWLGMVARLAGVDPTAVVLHESSLLVPLALVLALEMGRAVFGSPWLALTTVLAQVAMIALAPGGGGSYASLELPGTAARQLLVPATIALFFRFVRQPGPAFGLTLALSGMTLAFVHSTYALFVAIPLLGFGLARAVMAGVDVRRIAGALAAFGLPVILVFLWLRPIVAETRSHHPDAQERLRAMHQYASDLVVGSTSSYHLGPWFVSRAGAVAVAALVLVPLAAFAGRRRWSAYVLGGTVLVLALELWPFSFTHFSDLVSVSQSRRAAGFVPFVIAFAGGAAVLTRLTRWFVLPIALGAGIALQLVYPGDFDTRLQRGGPALVTWIALWGAVAGIAVGAVLVRRGRGGRFESTGPLAAAAAFLFVLPVAIHGFANWEPRKPTDGYALTPGLVEFLQKRVPKGVVVYADLETSYRISAYVPVYVANGPPAHVADTKANRPHFRRGELLRYLRTGNLAIPRRRGAQWLVLRDQEPVGRGARLVYRDGRFRVYRI